MAEKYNKLLSEGKEIEIIFISSDRDESSALTYFSGMPWKMFAFSEREKKASLSKLFDVQGIPTLVLLKSNGKVITTEGREAIMTVEFDKLDHYEEYKRQEQERIAQEVAAMPNTVKHPKHEHELVKELCPYGGGSYGCDLCGDGGSGWSYRCAACNFDAHPHCANEKESV